MNTIIRARDFIDEKIGVDYKLLTMNIVVKDMHYHDYWEFFVVIEGSIFHNINGKQIKLNTGKTVFIRPQDYHNYSSVKDTECKFINIAIESHIIHKLSDYLNINIEKIFLKKEMPSTIQLSADDVKKFYDDFLKLQTIPSDHLNEKMSFNRSVIFSIISKFILEESRTEQYDSVPAWLQQVFKIMNKPENIEGGIESLIKISGFSHGYLCRIFKQYLDVSPVQYITKIRLSYSANLLTTTDISILDIANRVGYSSASHFIKAFRKQYGVLPSKYRNKFYFNV
jgi:AraC family cel operon transcriptional repressor